jgi:UDP-N-acetyl-D-mannosaminuronate dehydrogenase
VLEETIEPQTEREPDTRAWDAAVVGAGYVGVPLAHTLATAGRSVLLIDVSENVVDALNRGQSHITDVPSEELATLVEQGRIRATMDYAIAHLSFRYAPTKLPCLAASNCGVIATFPKF